MENQQRTTPRTMLGNIGREWVILYTNDAGFLDSYPEVSSKELDKLLDYRAFIECTLFPYCDDYFLKKTNEVRREIDEEFKIVREENVKFETESMEVSVSFYLAESPFTWIINCFLWSYEILGHEQEYYDDRDVIILLDKKVFREKDVVKTFNDLVKTVAIRKKTNIHEIAKDYVELIARRNNSSLLN